MARRQNKLTENDLSGISGFLSFEEAVDLLLQNCKIKNLREHTIKFYKNELSRSKKLFDLQSINTRIDKITEKNIRTNIIDYMRLIEGRTVVSVNSRLRALRRLFNFLHENGYIVINPMYSITPLKTDKRDQPNLNTEQIHALLMQPDQSTFTGFRDFTLMLLFLETGIRINELIHIKVNDILWEEHLLRVSHAKNRTERFVPFQEKMKKRLLDYIKLRGDVKTDALFVTIDGKPLSTRRIQEWISEYADKAGIHDVKVSPHCFRYTFVKYAVKGGANIFVIQEILGHKTLDMVRHYYNVYGRDKIDEHKKFSIADRVLK
ncbi:tyrosine-type recombinase/integrase [Halalkalibacter urbisdiaboli]|uniref:tyrosine-type recombinase/integrase n=1 Tax=Halalkalibacter urbisdiaboli TaxID=1960589 RepID=UPI000B43EE1F|nr:tyrosine-type recombinase/integrase [Halalkalibacter urbisdiaboli]